VGGSGSNATSGRAERGKRSGAGGFIAASERERALPGLGLEGFSFGRGGEHVEEGRLLAGDASGGTPKPKNSPVPFPTAARARSWPLPFARLSLPGRPQERDGLGGLWEQITGVP
jgi:hypothetical protein